MRSSYRTLLGRLPHQQPTLREPDSPSCEEEIKSLFMRYRSSLGGTVVTCDHGPDTPCFVADHPHSESGFRALLKHYSLIFRVRTIHATAFPPRRYAHFRSRLLHLFDEALRATPNATDLLFSRNDRYSPMAPPVISVWSSGACLVFALRLLPRPNIPIICTRAFAFAISYPRTTLAVLVRLLARRLGSPSRFHPFAFSSPMACGHKLRSG